MSTLAATIVSSIVIPALARGERRITLTEATTPGVCLRDLRLPLAQLLPGWDVYAITVFSHETYPETPTTVLTLDRIG